MSSRLLLQTGRAILRPSLLCIHRLLQSWVSVSDWSQTQILIGPAVNQILPQLEGRLAEGWSDLCGWRFQVFDSLTF